MKSFGKYRKLKIIFLLLAIVLIFTSCSNKEDANMNPEGLNASKEGGVLNLASFPPDTLNPLTTEYASVRDYLYLAYEGLFVVNEDLTVKGVLAEDFKASKQNTVFKINLKKGVKFHDGTKFTSKDVIDTFKYIQMYETNYSDVLGNVQSFTADGDYKITITLKTPQANFPANLDFPVLSSGLSMEDFLVPNSKYKINGTGRYKFKEENEYQSLVLQKNTAWHCDDEVNIPTVNIRYVSDTDSIAYAFDAGETDMVTTEYGRWGEFSYKVKHRSFEITTTKYVFLGINTSGTAFSDAEYRRSILSVIDKGHITESFMFGHASVSDTPISSKAYFYLNDGENPGKANKNYLSDKKHSAYILYNEETGYKEDIARYLKSELEDAGVKVELTKVDYDTYCNKIASGDYQLYIGEIDMKRDSDLSFMFASYNPPADDSEENENKTDYQSAGNICNYTSSALSDIIGNINSSKDAESLKVAYNNLRRYYTENVPQIPLFHIKDAVLISDRIKGTPNVNLTNFFADIGNIYVSKK